MRTSRGRSGTEEQGARKTAVVTSTLSEARKPAKHTHTVVVDFDVFIKGVADLPDPAQHVMTYTQEAIDLINYAADETYDFGSAASEAPEGAGWLEQLLSIPDEIFGTAYDTLRNYQDRPVFFEDDRSSTEEHLAETIMANHILNLSFFSAVYDYLRYAEPETSQELGENLI